MRICVLIDAWKPVWGGGQAHVWEISLRLAKNLNYKIDIVAPNLLEDRKGDNEKNIVYGWDKLKIIKIGPQFTFPSISGRLFFLLDLTRFVWRSDYDIYHSHSYSTSLPLMLLKLLKGKKVVFTLHGRGVKVIGGGFLNRLGLASFLEKIVLFKFPYDALISVAESSIDSKPAAKILRIIGNGVEVSDFDRVKVSQEKGVFRMIWVGRLDPVKGLEYLLEAIKNLTKSSKRIKLVIIGDGPDRERLEKLVKELKLSKFVTMKGGVYGDQRIRELKMSNLYVLSSLSEGLPLTILEAMAARLPVVATKVGAIPNLIKDNYSGYLARPADPVSLSQALEKSMKAKDLRLFGQRGYRLVKKFYSWDKVASDVDVVYRTLTY